MGLPQSTLKFWTELRRRRVVRVAIAYAIPAFVVMEAADILVPALTLPGWIVTVVVSACIVGFPLVLVLAWKFDITPEGVVRTGPLDRSNAEESGTIFDRRAIAVLPFTNLSDDPENEYFTDGVMEDILIRLSCCRDLHVISRTSSMAYKGTTKPVREIAADLKVGTVLEGSVRRCEDRVRVAAQLIDSATDKHLWAEVYDRDLEDIFAVQSEVAERIVEALETKLGPEELERMRRRPTENLEAYELFLQGRQDVYEAQGTDIQRGLRRLDGAIELDPGFAAAHAMIGLAHLTAPYWSGVRSADSMPLARQAADRALELDDSLAIAWVARAGVRYHYEWDWVGAQKDFAQAVIRDPNLPDIYLWQGMSLLLLECYEEAAVALEQGTSLDPHSGLMTGFLGFARHFEGRRSAGERILRAALARHERFDVANLLAWCLMEEGRFDEAADTFEVAAEMTGGHPYLVTSKAVALHRGGRTEEATGLVAAVRANAPQAYVTHELLAYMALVEGDLDEAVDQLWAAADERSVTVLWYRAVKVFREVEDFTRWRALLHRIWPEDYPEGHSVAVGGA